MIRSISSTGSQGQDEMVIIGSRERYWKRANESSLGGIWNFNAARSHVTWSHCWPSARGLNRPPRVKWSRRSQPSTSNALFSSLATMSRRESRVSINVRQNDALNEFENCLYIPTSLTSWVSLTVAQSRRSSYSPINISLSKYHKFLFRCILAWSVFGIVDLIQPWVSA